MAPPAALAARRSEIVSPSEVSSPPVTRTRQDALLRRSFMNLRERKTLQADGLCEEIVSSMARSPLGLSMCQAEAAISPMLGSIKAPSQLEEQRKSEMAESDYSWTVFPSKDTVSGNKNDAEVDSAGDRLTGPSSPGSPVFDFSKSSGLPNSSSKPLLTNTPVLNPSLEMVDITDDKDQDSLGEVLSLQSGEMAYHSDVVQVVFGREAYSSRLVTKVPFANGSIIAKIEGVTFGVYKRFTSVQCGPNTHLELNSDLVYINHSCNPNVAMDVDAMEVRALRDIAVGEELTFFYPSTEWDMDQPFQCWCKAEQCVGLVAGAKHLPADVFGLYWFSRHILDLSTAHSQSIADCAAHCLALEKSSP